MRPTEHFEVDPVMKWMFFAAPVVFIGFALLGVALLVLPGDGRPRNEAFERGLGAVLALAFGGAAWYSWRLVRQVKAAPVSLDAEGIWQQSQHRESGIVRWQDIARVRERTYLQRLELLGRSGALLLKVEYQLAEFERLCAIVLSRAALVQSSAIQAKTFSKGASHHVLSVAVILCFTAIGIYALFEKPLLGVLFMLSVVGMCSWEYLTAVHKLELRANDLVAHRPGRHALLRREEIQSIEISDAYANFARLPQVVVHTYGQSGTLKLRNLGVQATELQQALLRWKSGTA